MESITTRYIGFQALIRQLLHAMTLLDIMLIFGHPETKQKTFQK